MGFSYITMGDYQHEAGKTAVFDPDTGLYYTALGLASEAGEVAGKVKKIIRDAGGQLTPDKQAEIEDELGDVLWYVAALARQIDADLDWVAIRNLEKLADRQRRGVIGGSGDKR